MQSSLYLVCAILLEVAGTTSMKLAQGFTHFVPSVLVFVFYAASFVALTFALRTMDIGVAYAVWSGVGTALVATMGIFLFREPVTALKLVSIVLVVAGVAGLYLSGISH